MFEKNYVPSTPFDEKQGEKGWKLRKLREARETGKIMSIKLYYVTTALSIISEVENFEDV